MPTPYMSDDERELQDFMNSIRSGIRERAVEMSTRSDAAVNLNTPQSGGILAEPYDDEEF